VLAWIAGAAVLAGGAAALAPQAAAAPSGLREFGTCAGFLRYVKREAGRLAQPWGLPGVAGGAIALPASGAAEGGDAGAPQAGVDYSPTNVQEPGIDEPDVVKTDGSLIFALAGTTLYAVDLTGPEPRLAGSLELPDAWGAQLLLHGDRLVVLSSSGGVIPLGGTEIAPEAIPWTPQARLTLVDVSDPAAMTVEQTLTVDGVLVASRLAGATARIVLSSAPQVEIPWPADGPPASEKDALRLVRRAVARSGVGDWVPTLTLRDELAGRSTRRRAAACHDVARPRAFAGLGMLTVLTLDLDRGLDPVDTDAVFAGGDLAYASADKLYVATQRWNDWAVDQQGPPPPVTTDLHAFDVSRAGETDYAGSGSVPGYLLGQWSMSEHRGFLRVASTEEPVWWEGKTRGESESRVTVLEEQEGALAKVGEVTGLGRGERIYAVRFLGETGYVVTFRQVDPLYVLDLSDPARPSVAGELELLGYSAYLHPIGDGLLLGVGQDATPEGRPLGTQVSVFDVSDPAHPALVARRGLAPGWSQVEWDHHAFLWWPATGLAVVPVQAAVWDENGAVHDVSGAVGLHAGPGGLEEVGRVTHPAGQIMRSLVAAGALYTVSDAGVKQSDLLTLADRAWVPFPGTVAPPGPSAEEPPVP
jgi:hypothetical protein